MNNKRKGISLIVLVITIVVMIILSIAIILSLTEKNIVFVSHKAEFQNDVKIMEEELTSYIANRILENNGIYEYIKLNADKNSLVENEKVLEGKNITDILASMEKEYIDKIEIKNGKIIYIGDNSKEIEWFNEIFK